MTTQNVNVEQKCWRINMYYRIGHSNRLEYACTEPYQYCAYNLQKNYAQVCTLGFTRGGETDRQMCSVWDQHVVA